MRNAQALAVASQMSGALSEKLSALGALAKEGRLTAADLDQFGEKLSSLEAQELRLAMSQAALDQIDQAIVQLGRGQEGQLGLGMGQGVGTDDSTIPGMGMGQGLGLGPRPIDETGQVGPTKATNVEGGEGKKYPPIASWMFQGAQIRGEARKQFNDVVQAQQQGFAQAVEDKQIPRRHEKLVKDYYDQLEQAGK